METLLEYLWIGVRSCLAFGFVIGFIATIHEFGHYIIAKACGVRVDEFSLGVGPALLTRQMGDTEYNLRAIPVLAYVRPAGMDPEEEFEPGMDPGERSFQAKSFWAKQAILLGGSLFNFLGAIGLVTGLLWMVGQHASTIRVGGVLEDRPAAKAGILTNDIFLSMDGQELRDVNAAVNYIHGKAGVPVKVILARPKVDQLDENFRNDPEQVERLEVTVTPQDANGDGVGLMGISVAQFLLPGEDPVPVPFGEALERGVTTTLEGIVKLFQNLWGLLKRSIGKMEVPKEVGGPVQIIHIISKQSGFGIENLLYLTASLSVSIGVFNLLPIPALDGGRMVLLVIATFAGWWARFRGVEYEEGEIPFHQQMEEWLHLIGFLFLITLMILVTWKDIREILFGSDPAPKSPPAATAPATPGSGGEAAPGGEPAPSTP